MGHKFGILSLRNTHIQRAIRITIVAVCQSFCFFPTSTDFQYMVLKLSLCSKPQTAEKSSNLGGFITQKAVNKLLNSF
jgi:hypothetical protein